MAIKISMVDREVYREQMASIADDIRKKHPKTSSLDIRRKLHELVDVTE